VTRRRRERRRAAPAPEAKSKPSKRGVPWILVALAGLAIVALVLWTYERHQSSSHARSPLADLPPGVAGERAEALLGERHFLASLPYLRRALEETPRDPGMHVHYAVALLNAAHETRRHLGRDEFAVRGSPERVAILREARDHLNEGERMSQATGDRQFLAWTLATRGQAMLAWGMPWDAFSAYRQSERADSTVAEFSRQADRLLAAMERPTSRAEANVAP